MNAVTDPVSFELAERNDAPPAPPPRRRFTWPTTPEAAGEWVANAAVPLLIVGAIASAIAAVWP